MALTAARGVGMLAGVWLASAVVVAACVVSSFRLDLADGIGAALAANGARVLFGAGVGALFAVSGALRLASARERPLRELEILAVSTGGAGGGYLLAEQGSGVAALLLFALGALAGALLLVAAVRAIDRPRRWSNLLVLAALALMATVAALAGTYARSRRDAVAPLVTWLLGDLGGAGAASGLIAVLLALALVILALRALEGAPAARRDTLALVALGLGVGAAGPLAFVGTLAPRAVRRLGRGASEKALLPACAAAGAATVVAVDAVPRLLFGGYDFPWNVPAAVLAIPLFTGWNRARLRREVGAAGRGFEILELGLLAALTLAGFFLARTLALLIRALT